MARKNQYRKQYNQQISRLRRVMREAEQKGIMFPESPLPRRVKNPTAKTIERLKNITPTKLRARGYILKDDTGELLRATPRRQKKLREYSKTRQKENITKQLIELAESQETTDDILDVFNVKLVSELPEEVQEIWHKKFELEFKADTHSDDEFTNDVEDITKTYSTLYADDKETSWRDNVDWETGEVIEKPIDESEVAYEVLIDMLATGKNDTLCSTLMSILNDEMDYLDLTYGVGEGRRIIIERFKNAGQDIRYYADRAAFGYKESAIDNSVALVTIIRGGTPSTQDLMDIESAASEIPSEKTAKGGRFRR